MELRILNKRKTYSVKKFVYSTRIYSVWFITFLERISLDHLPDKKFYPQNYKVVLALTTDFKIIPFYWIKNIFMVQSPSVNCPLASMQGIQRNMHYPQSWYIGRIQEKHESQLVYQILYILLYGKEMQGDYILRNGIRS